MRSLAFRVPGDPRPQGSKRVLPHPSTGRALLVESAGPALKAWRGVVTLLVRKAIGGRPFSGAVAVMLVFHLRPPREIPRGRVAPTVRPDVDKLARAALDGLTAAGVWGDDAQVVHLTARKVYAARHEDPWTDVLIEEAAL